MALYWSWAFGPETALQLDNEMGFDLTATSTGEINPTTTYTYTYPGSPTRYSLGIERGDYLLTPTPVWIDAGWVCIPIYTEDQWAASTANHLVSVQGNNQQVSVYCSNSTTGELSLRFTGGGTSTFIISGTYSVNDWHYIALKYDTSITSPTAEVWINGVQQLAATASWSGTANTSGRYRSGGFSNLLTPPAAVIGQIVIYDTGSLASGNPYDPIYCTRVNPTIDETGVGTFTPSTGVNNYAVLDAPFDSSIYTENTASNIGDRVVCQASGASGFYSQLGTTPNDFRGITAHAWASGSGQDGFVGISDNNSTYDAGNPITPDINDPTYAYVTAADRPSDSAQWSTSSLLYVKYEVS